jgi:MFS family permease
MAMVKPQIAACFALPFLGRGRRRGLAVGLALLAGLTALALLHTNTDPLAYLASWLAVLPGFIGDGNVNAAASLLTGWRGSGSHHLLAAALLAGLAVIIGAWLGSKLLSSLADASRRGFGKAWRHQPLTLAGLCGVVGAVAVYHRNVDNIMLFPALLAALRLGLGRHRLVDGGLAVLMAASVWTPQRLLDLWPGSALAQSLIWGVLAIRLLAEMVSHGDEPVRPDSSSGMPRPADQRLAGAA